MNYIIIYDSTKVVSCIPYVDGTAIALSDRHSVIINTIDAAKALLSAANIDYSALSDSQMY